MAGLLAVAVNCRGRSSCQIDKSTNRLPTKIQFPIPWARQKVVPITKSILIDSLSFNCVERLIVEERRWNRLKKSPTRRWSRIGGGRPGGGQGGHNRKCGKGLIEIIANASTRWCRHEEKNFIFWSVSSDGGPSFIHRSGQLWHFRVGFLHEPIVTIAGVAVLNQLTRVEIDRSIGRSVFWSSEKKKKMITIIRIIIRKGLQFSANSISTEQRTITWGKRGEGGGWRGGCGARGGWNLKRMRRG